MTYYYFTPQTIMKLIITLSMIIIWAALEPAEGLECMSCVYTETKEGGEDLECRAGISPLILPCKQIGNSKPACTVTETSGEVSGVWTKQIIRECGSADDGGNGKAGCHKTKGPNNGGEVNHCVCFEDKCNAAESIRKVKSNSANNNLGLSAGVIGAVCLSLILFRLKK